MSPIDGLHPVTTEGQILLHIAGQLDELLATVRPDPAPVDPEPDPAPADEKPAKAPVKKAAAKTTRKVTGQ